MPSNDKPVSRREFARRTAALGSAAASASLFPFADFLPAAGAGAAPVQGAANAQPPSAQAKAEADSRYQSILNQYGDGLSEAQKGDVKRLCLVLQAPLERVRAYPVGNGDLPADYLKPLVDRDKKPSGTSAATAATSRSKEAAPTKPPTTGKP
jgi:hypothetical protein